MTENRRPNRKRKKAMSGLAVLAVLGGVVAFIAAGMHQVPEGHIAMYWRGGALLDTVAEPGWRWAPPMVTTRDFVQLTMQTDTVRDLLLLVDTQSGHRCARCRAARRRA
jgi:hypothetical protein